MMYVILTTVIVVTLLFFKGAGDLNAAEEAHFSATVETIDLNGKKTLSDHKEIATLFEQVEEDLDRLVDARKEIQGSSDKGSKEVKK